MKLTFGKGSIGVHGMVTTGDKGRKYIITLSKLKCMNAIGVAIPEQDSKIKVEMEFLNINSLDVLIQKCQALREVMSKVSE